MLSPLLKDKRMGRNNYFDRQREVLHRLERTCSCGKWMARGHIKNRNKYITCYICQCGEIHILGKSSGIYQGNWRGNMKEHKFKVWYK